MATHAFVPAKCHSQRKASGSSLTDKTATKFQIETDLFSAASIVWRCRTGINLIQFTGNRKECICGGLGIPKALGIQHPPFQIWCVGSTYNTELLIKLIRSVISWSPSEYFCAKQPLIILMRIVCLSIYRLAVGNTDCPQLAVLLRSRWHRMGAFVRCDPGVTQSHKSWASLQGGGFLTPDNSPAEERARPHQCARAKSSLHSFWIVNSVI